MQYTEREYALMEALREALAMLTPKQAFAESQKYDSLFMKTLPLDLRDVPPTFTFEVKRLGRWLFPWGFVVLDASGTPVYGEHHIESRRAATKDAKDICDRLSDGRLTITNGTLVHHL